MMQGEKVAADLRDALDAVAGSASPVPTLAAAVRRLERRQGQAPQFIAPAVKAFDAALSALDEARTNLERALADADHDPAELERIEERLFALRAAGRKYSVPVDDLAALGARYAADLELIDAGAQRLAQLEAAARDAGTRFATAASKLAEARRRDRARVSTKPSMPSLRPCGSSARGSPPISRASSRDRTASIGSSSGSRPIQAPGRGR